MRFDLGRIKEIAVENYHDLYRLTADHSTVNCTMGWDTEWGKIRFARKILVGKTLWIRPLWRPRIYEDDIKMDLRATGLKTRWLRVHWRALISAILRLWVWLPESQFAFDKQYRTRTRARWIEPPCVTFLEKRGTKMTHNRRVVLEYGSKRNFLVEEF